ncbi:MAG: carboxypeptidase regulatory-like domain-containing protein [Acidobacteriota bacterium]|nr:carboxypeptidase regulatory-like domain-containing protein [Acidobacteriota bacterium]
MYASRLIPAAFLAVALVIPATTGFAQANPAMASAARAQSGEQLEVSITASDAHAVEPFPIRLVLRLHNAGKRTLWLYTPAIDASAMNGNPGGSSLAVHLEPEEKAGATSSVPAMGSVLRVAGFPRSQLIPLAPGSDSTENLAIQAAPAMAPTTRGQEPRWGSYRLSLVYSAGYPNGNEIRRTLGVDLWVGSILTNAVNISLAPPASSAEGMILGTVTNRNGLTLAGILVSLTDSDERLVAQSVTNPDGGFQFSHLPFGRYWITVRDLGADRDTSFFEHADLSAGEPDARMKLIMLDQEVYEANRVLHKPVLFRIDDGAGNPVADAELKILWSDGPLIQNLKIDANQNGLAVANLIPGSNYVTVSKRHCPKLDQMAGVRPGGGIDAFAFTFICKK